jgi:hypothetical protein
MASGRDTMSVPRFPFDRETAMKKIRLDLDELQVESLATESLPEPERGTVHAEEMSCPCGTSKIGGCWCTECC